MVPKRSMMCLSLGKSKKRYIHLMLISLRFYKKPRTNSFMLKMSRSYYIIVIIPNIGFKFPLCFLFSCK